MQFRPMLAVQAKIPEIRYPVFGSYKMDGIRAMVVDGQLISRTLKPIPNNWLRSQFGKKKYEGLDGELTLIDDSGCAVPDGYRDTVSLVMTEDYEPQGISWVTFDCFNSPDEPYYKRLESVHSFRVRTVLIENEQQLMAFEAEALNKNYEGIIIRDPDAPYKFGRSTLKQGWMLKVKRFEDDEAKVVDFEELMHNTNPAQLDERGYTKHTSHQENKVPMDRLGALVVIWQGQLLRIGSGFTKMERYTIWRYKEKYRGKLVKFKYLRTGMKDLPRHPVFLGWRHAADVGG